MKSRLFLASFLAVALCLCISASSASSPVIEKIDPPNWWIGHSINPVQLLVRGRGLSQAKLRADSPGVTVRSSAPAGDDYLIAYLEIDPQKAVPGDITLTIENGDGSSHADFALLPLPDKAGKYQGFSPDDVIYLIMIDRFADGDQSNNNPPNASGVYDRRQPRAYHGGDLQGIIDRLPYLKDLGVTTIWVTPIYDNAGATDYHGYGAVDFYSAEEHFGDTAKFRELTDKAHALDMKVIQDQVMNHTGPGHPWVNRLEPFLNGSKRQHANNVFDIPSLTRSDSDAARVGATLDGWFADILPDVNQGNPETAQYLIQNTLWWIGQTGIDGIRADTYPYVPRSFWSRWEAAIKRQHPQFDVVGEVFHGDPAVTSFFQGGVKRFDGIDSGLDTVFDFPNYYVIRQFFIGGKRSLSEMLRSDSLYPRPEILVPFIGNHDVKRFASEMGATSDKMILAFAYLLTMRGVPQIYSGDEIGLEGGIDPDNRRDFPGGFPGDARSAFTSEGRTKRENRIFSAVRKLLEIRRAQPALRGGDMTFLHDENGLLAYLRVRDSERIIVAINNTDSAAKWSAKLPEGLVIKNRQAADMLGKSPTLRVRRGVLSISLGARRAAIYRLVD